MKKFIQFIKRMVSTIVAYFGKLVILNDEIVKKYAPIAVDVCNFIKKYSGNSIVKDLELFLEKSGIPIISKGINIVSIITSDKVIDKIIKVLDLSEKVSATTTLQDKIILISSYISTLTKDGKKDSWTSVASIIAEALSDGKLSWKELFIIIEGIYDKKRNVITE